MQRSCHLPHRNLLFLPDTHLSTCKFDDDPIWPEIQYEGQASGQVSVMFPLAISVHVANAPCRPTTTRSGPADAPTTTPNNSVDAPMTTPDGPTTTPDGPTITPDGLTATLNSPTTMPNGPTATPDDLATTPDGPTTMPDSPVCAPSATPDGPVNAHAMTTSDSVTPFTISTDGPIATGPGLNTDAPTDGKQDQADTSSQGPSSVYVNHFSPLFAGFDHSSNTS